MEGLGQIVYNEMRMFKGKLWLHQLVLFGVLGVLVVWSVINKSFVFNINLLWWLLGAMIGFLFVFLDRFVYSILANPSGTLSLRIKELFTQKNFVGGIKLLLAERYEQKELVMRSAMFLVVWLVLAFFTMTSVANFFARGFVLGIGTHLIFDLIYDFVKDKERLDQWFWQIKRTLEPEEKFWFVVIAGILYIFLAFGL
jgi:hypothetical protein